MEFDLEKLGVRGLAVKRSPYFTKKNQNVGDRRARALHPRDVNIEVKDEQENDSTLVKFGHRNGLVTCSKLAPPAQNHVSLNAPTCSSLESNRGTSSNSFVEDVQRFEPRAFSITTWEKKGASSASLNSCSSKLHRTANVGTSHGRHVGIKDERSDTGELWTTKYSPKAMSDLVGNTVQIQRLTQWLSAWDGHHLRPKSSNVVRHCGSTNFQAPQQFKKAVLLYGGPGVGKSSSARVICKRFGYDIVEVNASDSRVKSDKDIRTGMKGHLANLVKELVTNYSLTLHKRDKKVVLVMDEVDGMSTGDKGGLQELVQTIQRSKIPIICICNEKYNPNIKSLLNHCFELGFGKPSTQQVYGRLEAIAKKEGLQVHKRTLEILSESSQGDLRLAINRLQFMSKDPASLYANKAAEESHRSFKDVELDIFAAADRLLSGASRSMSLSEQMDLVFQNPDLVSLIIQENYINHRPLKTYCELAHMECIVQAADAIGDGDLVNARLQKSQQWQLMLFACIQSGVACSAYVRGTRQCLSQGERNFNRFAVWLGKNSTAAKHLRQLAEVQNHLLASGNSRTSREALCQDYFPAFARHLTAPLQQKDKEGVCEVLDVMNQYGLTKEDRDAILEMCSLKAFQDPQVGITAQTKRTFTRVCNQWEAKRRVKSGCMLADLNAKKRKAAPGEEDHKSFAESSAEEDEEGVCGKNAKIAKRISSEEKKKERQGSRVPRGMAQRRTGGREWNSTTVAGTMNSENGAWGDELGLVMGAGRGR